MALGDQLVIISAMKMETAVCAPCSGPVQHVAVLKGDVVDAGDLLVKLSPTNGKNVKVPTEMKEEKQPAEAVSN